MPYPMKKKESKMNNIYLLVYYEGDEQRLLWDIHKKKLAYQVKEWEKQGLGVGNDTIHQISFASTEELVDVLNDIESSNLY